MALIIHPSVTFLHNRARFPKAAATAVSLLLLICGLTGLFALFVIEIVSGASHISGNIPGYMDRITALSENMIKSSLLPMYDTFSSFFRNLSAEEQKAIIDNIQNGSKTMAEAAGNFAQQLFQKIPAVIGWFPNAFSVLIFSTLAAFFISIELERLKRFSTNIVPFKIRKSFHSVLADLKKALFGFLKAQFLLVSITTIIVLSGLLILRVEYSITIAVLVGIVDILPYIGSGLIFIPWLLYEILNGNPALATGLGVLYFIVIVQRQIMEPKVLSSSIGLHPLATLAALFVGYKWMGFAGLIAGPVLLVIIQTLYKNNVFHDIWNYIKGS